MPRDNQGNYSLPSSYLAVTGEDATATQHNAPLEDLASAVSASLPVNGAKAMTGPIKLVDGTVSAPGVVFNLNQQTGLYKTDNGFGVSIDGTRVAEFTGDGPTSTSINLEGSTSGTGTLSPPAVASTYTWTLPAASGTLATTPDNYLSGLTLSNNATDATNDIDIAVGVAADSANAVLMRLASALTKRLDATWAVGTNQGGLDTGTIANDTYHLWLIRRSDTGVVDVLFSASATSPTMPTDYDQKRRIGSILRVSGSIVGFTQYGDKFLRNSMSNELTGSTMSVGAQLIGVGVPSGINVGALLRVRSDYSSSAASIMWSSPAETDVAPGTTNGQTMSVATTSTVSTATIEVQTNTSSQVRFNTNESTSHHYCWTYGWIDRRGQ